MSAAAACRRAGLALAAVLAAAGHAAGQPAAAPGAVEAAQRAALAELAGRAASPFFSDLRGGVAEALRAASRAVPRRPLEEAQEAPPSAAPPAPAGGTVRMPRNLDFDRHRICASGVGGWCVDCF